MPHEITCAGTNADGSPCGALPRFVGDDGFCFSHDPARHDELVAAARAGGEATARRHRGGGLDPDELGALESVEDCRRAAELVYRGVTTGRLGHREGATAVRAIEAAQKLLQTAAREEIQELRAELRRVKNMRAVR